MGQQEKATQDRCRLGEVLQRQKEHDVPIELDSGTIKDGA
jgi:hypothetical protein